MRMTKLDLLHMSLETYVQSQQPAVPSLLVDRLDTSPFAMETLLDDSQLIVMLSSLCVELN